MRERARACVCVCTDAYDVSNTFSLSENIKYGLKNMDKKR